MNSVIKKILCNVIDDHSYEFVRNIYGDEINQHNGMRSEWKCTKCGKISYQETLHNKIGDELKTIYKNYYKNAFQNWVNSKTELLSNITEICKNAASEGKSYVEIYIMCDSKTNDIDNYYKWCKENNLKLDTLSGSNENVQIKRYTFRISWD